MESVKPDKHLLKKLTGPAASLLEVSEAMTSPSRLSAGLEPHGGQRSHDELAPGLSADLGPMMEMLTLDKAKLKSLAKIIEQAQTDAAADPSSSNCSPLRIRLLQHASGKAIIERAQLFLSEHASTLRSQLQGDALNSLIAGLDAAVRDFLVSTDDTQSHDDERRVEKVVRGIDKLVDKLNEEPAHHGSLSSLPMVVQDWGHWPQPSTTDPSPNGKYCAPPILI